MKQPLALSLALAVAVTTLLSAAPPAPRPALPAINDPAYPALKTGGWALQGGGPAPRCSLPDKAGAKAAFPQKGSDMGNSLCKHHVWQLLALEEPWNAGRAVKAADWDKLTAEQQLQKLGELKAFYLALDGAYKGVLDAARGVLQAYGGKDQDSKIWDAGGSKAGPALQAYYDALGGLEGFLNGATRGGAGGGPAQVPPKGSAIDRVDPVLLKLLKGADEVLGDQLFGIASEMEMARSQVAGGAGAGPDVGRAEQRVGQRVTDWNAALRGADMDQALGKAFDAAAERGQLTAQEAQGGRAALAGKAFVVKSADGRSYVAQPVTVPGAKKGDPAVQTFKYAEITPESTMDSVSRDLVENIRKDNGFKSKLAGLADAASDAARHPGRTAREAAQNVAQEQGPFAFMSGQTRPDMERKIEADRSRDAAKASDEFTSAAEGIQSQFEAAWAECGRKWAELDKEEGFIAKLAAGEQAAARADLQKRRSELTVLGPSRKTAADPAKTERAPVPCSKGREELTSAYRDARGEAEDALKATESRLTATAGLEKGKIDEKISVRRQLRRQYFRDELLKSRAKLEGMIPSFVPAETRKKIVANHFVQTYPDKDGKFYLPEDWKITIPAAPEAKDFGKWAQVEAADSFKTAKEDAFIGQMEAKYPYLKEHLFGSAPPPNDDVVRKDAQEKIAADFEAWFENKDKRDPKSPDAPDLAKVERRKAPDTKVGK